MSLIASASNLSWANMFGLAWEQTDIAYNFAVLVNGAPLGGFSQVQGLQREIEVEEYREGGRNHSARQLFKGGKWSTVTLKGGSLNSSYMWNWIHSVNEALGPLDNVVGAAAAAVANPLAGLGALASMGAAASGKTKPTFRREVMIVHFTREFLPIRVYHLHRAYPKRWKAPDLDAEQSNGANEELELAFESCIPMIIPLPSY